MGLIPRTCSFYCCTFCFGVSLLSLGIIVTSSKSLLLDIVRSSFILKPNTLIEEYWRKTAEISTNVYIFNWTNAEDLHNTSIKPKFEQLGPYKFLQNAEKVNIVWNSNNTITYNQVRTWRFDEEHSKRNLSDKIVTVNILTLYIAHKVRFWSYFSKGTVSFVMNAAFPEVPLTSTAKKLLYEGFDELSSGVISNLLFMVPEVPQFEAFGILGFRHTNPDFEGVFNMVNGANGNYELRNWNYRNKTSAFEGSCAEVHGSAGELHSSKLTRDYLTIFYADVCRQIIFEYEKDVVIDGILGYKYSIGNKILDNGTLIPENKCYCPGECMPSGVVNVSSCRYGLPVFGSLPNFYGGDPTYVNAIEGILPDKEKHETYIVVEPNTGVPLKAMLRIQLNVLMQPIEYMGVFENVPKIYHPLAWVEMEISIPEHLRPMLKIALNAPFVLNAISNTLISIGLCLIIATVVYKPLLRKLHPKKKIIIPKAEEVPLQNDEKCVNLSIKDNSV